MITKTRSLVKTIIWRIISFILTIGIVYITTGNLTAAFSIGAIEVVIKFVSYYSYERIWNKIKWGIK